MTTIKYNFIKVINYRNIIEERIWTPNICSPEHKQILQKAYLQLKGLKSESCQLKDLESVFQSSLR